MRIPKPVHASVSSFGELCAHCLLPVPAEQEWVIWVQVQDIAGRLGPAPLHDACWVPWWLERGDTLG